MFDNIYFETSMLYSNISYNTIIKPLFQNKLW